MIQFDRDRWERIRDTYDQWWAHKLQRPVVKATLSTPYDSQGAIPLLDQWNCADLRVSPEDIVNRLDMHLSHQEYLGDAFPYVNFGSFGPGVLAAMLDADLDTSTGTVWYHYRKPFDIEQFHFEYRPDNVWLGRIKDIYHAGLKKWQGNVLMGMTDLGGIMDVLATFCGTENLLMELYDNPEHVKRLTRELVSLWHKIYEELNDVLQPVNPGYSDWSGLYSSKASYITQCDFSYMISPDMFAQFVLDDLREQSKRLTKSFYHLDGQGELPHLDQILGIAELDGVQWIPGDGSPPAGEWPEVYRRILGAGKLVHVAGGIADFNAISSAVGGKGLYFDCRGTDRAELERVLAEHGVPN